ncbi:MAG: anti-sigma factor antagonist [Anaerolineae bacterium]|nr:anti-sigma factor antagonist [Anaerolineae bacterium]
MATKIERQLRVVAQLDQITPAREFVADAAVEAGLDERGVYHCQVAVDEVMTNIIEHGFGGGSAAQIDVRCATVDRQFVITIIDGSPPFDPTAHKDPDPAMSLDEREPGGWGIFFIKSMMDDISYRHEDGLNYLSLIKNLPETPAAAEEAEVHRREVQPGVWLVAPHGRLDSVSSQPFEALLKADIDAGHATVIVDMSAVSYIASSGLKALVSAWRRASSVHGALTLAGLRPRVREVFEIVGFDQVFRIYDDVEQAVRAAQIAEGQNS